VIPHRVGQIRRGRNQIVARAAFRLDAVTGRAALSIRILTGSNGLRRRRNRILDRGGSSIALREENDAPDEAETTPMIVVRRGAFT